MNFKEYFGFSEKDIKQNCIICQSFDISLFADKISNGFFVKSAYIRNAIIIALKNNFLAGDAVLYLENTKCKNIILFSCCGGCNDIKCGDLIAVNKAYNLESFSGMLNFCGVPNYYNSSKKLLLDFYKRNHCKNLIETNSACVGSLVLESKFSEWFKENKISVVDMESSIILSAAEKTKKDAVCLMYVSDLIGQDFIINGNDKLSKKRIAASRKKLANMILRFCNEK
ncbi:MAG: hypothetical protein LBR09_01845 [Endomicrobium sp.]|jgi:purine-nucleoside phosphorylase|nr:hypothetical protein [Endomicrobium sp.]